MGSVAEGPGEYAERGFDEEDQPEPTGIEGVIRAQQDAAIAAAHAEVEAANSWSAAVIGLGLCAVWVAAIVTGHTHLPIFG